MGNALISEATLTKQVKAFLDGLSHTWYFKVWGGGMQKRGIPDIIGIKNGRFFALELKASDGCPTALQKRNIKLIKKVGGYAVIVWPCDWERVKGELLKL